MLLGTLRSTATRDVTVQAATLAEARAAMEAQAPSGWVVTDAKVVLNGEPAGRFAAVTMKGTLANWGDTQEIEAGDFDALHAAVPTGYELILIRTA